MYKILTNSILSNKMRMQILLLIAGIFFFGPLFAQQNYSPGYIIRINGDSVTGFINHRGWESNPTEIYFKEKISDQKQILKPVDIIRFSVGNEFYCSAIVKTEISSRDIQELQSNRAPELVTDTVFLQTVIGGDKCLYFYKRSKGNEQFYIKSDSGYELLVYKPYLTEAGNQESMAENLEYKVQLSKYLGIDPEIQSKVLTTTYNRSSLEKLFNLYYLKSNSKIIFQNKKQKISTETGILAGLSMASLKFTDGGRAFTTLAGTKFSQSTNLTAGIFFNIVLPGSQQRWSVYNELIYTSYQITGSYAESTNTENIIKITYTNFDFTYLKINNLLRFKFPISSKQLFLFANAGISNGIAISKNDPQKVVNTYYGTNEVTNLNAMESPRSYEQGLILGLGARFKNYSSEIRFEKGNGMASALLLGSATTRLSLLFGYRF